MVKLVDQNIPPELESIFLQIISPQKKLATGATKARTRRAVKRPRTIKKKKAAIRYFDDAATILAIRLELVPSSQEFKDFVYNQAKDLKLGIFNPLYWTKLVLTAEEKITCYPTATRYTKARAYAYPDPANQPSVAHYTDCNFTGLPVMYNGVTAYDAMQPPEQTSSWDSGASKWDNGNAQWDVALIPASRFRDLELTWMMNTYKAQHPIGTRELDPIIMSWKPEILVNASNRGSRAMFSVIYKARVFLDGNYAVLPLIPLTTKPKNFYHRFKSLITPPPFYTAAKALHIVKVINNDFVKSLSGSDQYITIEAGNKPMMGKAYNNNTQVTTSFINKPELYSLIIKKIRDSSPILRFMEGDTGFLDIETGVVINTALPKFWEILEIYQDVALVTNGNSEYWVTDNTLLPKVKLNFVITGDGTDFKVSKFPGGFLITWWLIYGELLKVFIYSKTGALILESDTDHVFTVNRFEARKITNLNPANWSATWGTWGFNYMWNLTTDERLQTDSRFGGKYNTSNHLGIWMGFQQQHTQTNAYPTTAGILPPPVNLVTHYSTGNFVVGTRNTFFLWNKGHLPEEWDLNGFIRYLPEPERMGFELRPFYKFVLTDPNIII